MAREAEHYSEIREHKFEGPPPNGFASWPAFAESIPLYEIVNKEMLFGDDKEPFFLVLDIAEVGATSDNGLIYDDVLIADIEAQLPGLGGLRGHLDAGSPAYPIEVVDWVGHVRVGSKVYAKGYIAPGEDRKAITRIIARGGEVRTSIDVWAMKEVADKKANTYRFRQTVLHTIDLVGAKKAALVKYQSGKGIITSEIVDQENLMQTDEKPVVPPAPVNLTEAFVSDLQGRVLSVEQERTALQTELQEAQTQLQEARQYAGIIGQIRVNLGYGENVSNDELAPMITQMYEAMQAVAAKLGNPASIEVSLSEVLSANQEMKAQEAARSLDDLVNTYSESWNVRTEEGKAKVATLLKNFKRTIKTEVKEGEALSETAARVWQEDYQTMAESVLVGIAGPGAVITPVTHKESVPGSLSDDELMAMAGRFIRR